MLDRVARYIPETVFFPEQTQDLILSDQNLPENQCIFVRGFRATRIAKILPWLRGAAGPARIPGEDHHDEDDSDTQVTSIPSNTDVRLSIRHSNLCLPDISKYQDPLHTLLEYIATVRVDDLRCVFIMRRTLQQAPDCDMALVHDDDILHIGGAVCSSVCRLCCAAHSRSRLDPSSQIP